MTALNAAGEYGNINANADAAADTLVFLTASSEAATSYNVFYATATANSIEFASATLVGTVNATGALSTLDFWNFA